MVKSIKNVELFRETVLRIAELKAEGLSSKEINRILDLVDYSKTSSYNIMRTAAARHILKQIGK